MSYTNQFFDTCYGDDSTKLQYLVGAALYHDEEILGKIIVIVGPPGSGKTSFLTYLWEFTKDDQQIKVRDDVWVDKVVEHHDKFQNRFGPVVDSNTVCFFATCKEPQRNDERFIILHTTGERLPMDVYKKYRSEMDSFRADFFKQCVSVYVFHQVFGEFPNNLL